jgi:hypothetical protein
MSIITNGTYNGINPLDFELSVVCHENLSKKKIMMRIIESE